MSFPPRQLSDFCNPSQARTDLKRHLKNEEWDDALNLACLLSETQFVQTALEAGGKLRNPCPPVYMLIKTGNLEALTMVEPKLQKGHKETIRIELHYLNEIFLNSNMCCFLWDTGFMSEQPTISDAIRHGAHSFLEHIVSARGQWEYNAIKYTREAIKHDYPEIAMLFVNHMSKYCYVCPRSDS